MAHSSQSLESVRRFSSPQEEVLLTLMRSADCLQREFQHRLRPFGITTTQYNVLRILRAAGPSGLTCSAIGRSMITPQPDITRLLTRLKAQNLVAQHQDREDKRVLWTNIVQPGLEILQKLDSIVDQAPRDLLSALNCTEVQELARLLKKAACCEKVPLSLDQSTVAQNKKRQVSEETQRQIPASPNAKAPSPQPRLLHPRPE
jgi:DNA-binding MarR family transcriptional regulator